MEQNHSARLWRYTSWDEANQRAMFLQGHWDNVIVQQSHRIAGTNGPTWLVIVWNDVDPWGTK